MRNLLTIFFITLITFSIQAQNEDFKMVVGVQAGYSLIGDIVKTLVDLDPSSNSDASLIPALQFTFDYGVSKVVSVGIAGSYQSVNLEFEDFTFLDIEDINNVDTRTETFKTTYRRFQIAVRTLFHYGNNDKLDMYSGIRVGILNRNFTDFEGENVDDIDEEIFESDGFNVSTGVGSRFSLAPIAFGLRGYFTENIGAGFEINIGAPYIVNAGVSARF